MDIAKASALSIALLLAGCATPVSVPALTDIGDRSCDPAPVLAAAVPTTATIDGDREKPAIVTVNAKSGCLQTSDGSALYALFALPDGGPYTVRVSSVPQGASLMAPRTSVLDDKGELIAELPVSSFLFRGDNLTILYRTHPGERYLLVRSDPRTVGKPLSRIKEAVQQTVVSTGYAAMIIYTGSDLPMDTMWSHNGLLRVSVVADKPVKK
ncbi:MAG: hypothetical protein JSR60_12750 [Proteobacteria bacterium]|nr:hypothetical protein [Pseudomonadota bacterium]